MIPNRCKPWLLALLLLGGRISWAETLAGYYTEEEIRYPARGEIADYIVQRKTWYVADRMRKEEDWLGTTIARFDLGRFYVLAPRAKNYYVVAADFIRQYADQGLQAFGAQRDAQGQWYFPEDLFVRTESTKKIGRWECYQVMTNPKYRQEDEPYAVIWYSADVDFPMQAYGDQLKNLIGDTPAVHDLFARLSRFEGYPVRYEAHDPNGFTITTLYKFERRQNLNPELFEIPKDYTQTPMPEEMPEPRWAP